MQFIMSTIQRHNSDNTCNIPRDPLGEEWKNWGVLGNRAPRVELTPELIREQQQQVKKERAADMRQKAEMYGDRTTFSRDDAHMALRMLVCEARRRDYAARAGTPQERRYADMEWLSLLDTVDDMMLGNNGVSAAYEATDVACELYNTRMWDDKLPIRHLVSASGEELLEQRRERQQRLLERIPEGGRSSPM